ncbi:hypothetical protein HDU79_006368 [Rhizoclosmatium sp. JEL0117]|nr:hypothetical protein HDU79_006368 [Rhizoclosmatium sp. JEL0117]
MPSSEASTRTPSSHNSFTCCTSDTLPVLPACSNCTDTVVHLQTHLAQLKRQLNRASTLLSTLGHTLPESDLELAFMPQEIIDLLIPYLTNPRTLINFCHALYPRLSHVSRAMYNVGTELGLPPQRVWPDFWFPVTFKHDPYSGLSLPTVSLDNPPLGIDTRPAREAVTRMVDLVNRYGGAGKLPIVSKAYIESVSSILPKRIDLYVGMMSGAVSEFRYQGEGYSDIVQAYARCGVQIRNLEVPYTVDMERMDVLKGLGISEVVDRVRVLRCFLASKLTWLRLMENSVYLEAIEFETCFNDSIEFGAVVDFIICAAKPNLRRITFEDRMQEQVKEARRGGLSKIGWTCEDGIGPIYGRGCVVWKKL